MTDSDTQVDGQGEPGEDTSTGRMRVLVPAAAVLAIVALVVGAIVIGGDDDDSASPSTSVAATTSPSVTEPPATTESGSTSPSTSQSAPGTTSAPGASSTTPPPQGADTTVAVADGPGGLATPIPPDVQPTEDQTCRGVKDGIVEYRALAVSTPIDDYIGLQLGLQEYEAVTDFVGGGQDWAIRIVELLTLVRRDWSTAFAADGSGDTTTRDERLEAALEFLDEAIDVPCPGE